MTLHLQVTLCFQIDQSLQLALRHQTDQVFLAYRRLQKFLLVPKYPQFPEDR